MSTEPLTLSTLARSKLHLSAIKDDCNLHRWVLLKNSIVRSSSSSSGTTTSTTRLDKTHASHLHPLDESNSQDEEACYEDDVDSSQFPEASKLGTSGRTDVNAAEAEWLDSLLETLDGYEEDVVADSHVQISVLPVEDDDISHPSFHSSAISWVELDPLPSYDTKDDGSTQEEGGSTPEPNIPFEGKDKRESSPSPGCFQNARNTEVNNAIFNDVQGDQTYIFFDHDTYNLNFNAHSPSPVACFVPTLPILAAQGFGFMTIYRRQDALEQQLYPTVYRTVATSAPIVGVILYLFKMKFGRRVI